MVFFSPFNEPLLNPYIVLNIEFGASDDDIAKAYKKLMLQLHPDKQPVDQSEEEAEEVSARFHDVMGARSFLLDGEHLASRREYESRLVAAEKAKAAAAAQQAAQAKAQAQQTARAQAQQQQQPAPASAHSSPKKDHTDPKVESPASKSKATTKSTSNITEPNRVDVNKTEDTFKKPNITKKQWGRVDRPARRVHIEKKECSEPTKLERKSSCSTTSEDSSSDDEGQPHRGRSKNRRSPLNGEKKSSNTLRSKEKKSPSSSAKPRKNSRKDSSSKRISDKNKERSHAISSKDKKSSETDKSPGTKKTSNKGETSNKGTLPDKSSSFKKASKTECTKQKQRYKSGRDNIKFSASCSSFFDDDDEKASIGAGGKATYARKSSDGAGGKAPENNANRKGSFDNTSSKATPPRAPSSSHTPLMPSKACPTPPAVCNAPALSRFDTFQPAVDTLTKQYLCPLTKEVMNEPMTDFEGNHYERDAILKYLETHNTSPVTGNALFPMHLTPNSALKERIKYTLKLKNCLDTLTHNENSTSTGGVINESNVQTSQQCHFKPLSLRQSVDMFIKELNSASPSGIINRLDSSGKAFFAYKGLDYILQVPEGLSHHVTLQTWFDQDKKAAGISARIVEWNRSLQEIGLGGKLTFRNIKGKFAFTLTREVKPEKFCKRDLKHAIEYYLEMSIKLHNTINVTDQKKVDKVRLDSSFAQ